MNSSEKKILTDHMSTDNVIETQSTNNSLADDTTSEFINLRNIKETMSDLIADLVKLEKSGAAILKSVNMQAGPQTIYREIYSCVDLLEIQRAEKYIEFCQSMNNCGLLPPRKKGRQIIAQLIELCEKLQDVHNCGLDINIVKTIAAYIITGRHSDLFIKWRTQEIDSQVKKPQGRLLNNISNQDLSEILLLANQLSLVNSLGDGVNFFKSIADKDEYIRFFCLCINKIDGHIRRANILLEMLDKKKELAYRHKTWGYNHQNENPQSFLI